MTITDTELERIWPLSKDLVVPEHGTIIVAGAYHGRYMDYLAERFLTATIYGFEPQPSPPEGYSKSGTVFNFGLGTANRKMMLGNAGTDGASVGSLEGRQIAVEIRDAVEEIHRLGLIDLFVCNMEGSEWALIPYLLDNLMHRRIASMAIQWHPGYVSAERESEVLLYLKQYYMLAYSDYPTWCHYLRRK